MWWIILISAILLLIAYVDAIRWEAKQRVDSAPRSDQMLCKVHGAVPRSCLIELPMPGITAEPIMQCPFCLRDRFKEARSHYK